MLLLIHTRYSNTWYVSQTLPQVPGSRVNYFWKISTRGTSSILPVLEVFWGSILLLNEYRLYLKYFGVLCTAHTFFWVLAVSKLSEYAQNTLKVIHSILQTSPHRFDNFIPFFSRKKQRRSHECSLEQITFVGANWSTFRGGVWQYFGRIIQVYCEYSQYFGVKPFCVGILYTILQVFRGSILLRRLLAVLLLLILPVRNVQYTPSILEVRTIIILAAYLW